MEVGIAAQARLRPGHTALVEGERAMTYAELWAAAAGFAEALGDAGLAPGDRVAVMVRNSIAWFVAVHGVAAAGGLVVPVSHRASADEAAYLIADSGAAAVVGDRWSWPVLRRAAPPGLRAFDADHLPSPQTLPPPERGPAVRTVPYTSGTTGRPKAVLRPDLGPDHLLQRTADLMAFWGFGASDVHLLCGPAHHSGPGFYALATLAVGGTVIVLPRFDAEAVLQALPGVTTSFMVPTHFVRLLQARRPVDTSSLRKVLHAAAPCPPAVKQAMLEWWGDVIWEFYGATEGLATVISPQQWRERPGSVGRAAPGVEVKVLDADGRELPPGQVGLVYIRSPVRFTYKDDPEATAAAWRGDLFTVGDMGYLDPDGYLYLTDRASDVIIRGGTNIWPAEVEAALQSLPGVEDCVVVGVPDPIYGEAVHAVVAGRGLDPEALLAALRARLAPYKVPSSIEVVDELPRDEAGKLPRRLVRQRYWQGLGRRI